jgi:hypothetical protein
MTTDHQRLYFSLSPKVEFAGNYFQDVPVILQYDDTPIISVTQEVTTGFTTEIEIYSNDGTYLAKAKGSQLYPTEEGMKANLVLRHPQGLTVCELNGETLFEMRRDGPAALRTRAELFTPDGRFMKCDPAGVPSELISFDGTCLQVGQFHMVRNTFVGCRVGILIGSDGEVRIGTT